MTKPRAFVFAFFIAIAAAAPTRPAHAISTPAIAASAITTSCLDYQLIGVCVWLTCIPFIACWVETSVEVRHYMPDLVVSSYHTTGANPWTYMLPLSLPNPLSWMGGDRTEGLAARVHNNLRFKNTSAGGHPAAAGFALLSHYPFFCHSAAVPMLPYYLSVYDPIAWRWGIPESAYPQSMVPGVRSIGYFGNVWGHVYPRTGFMVQANDYKAAAVAAQRVADFVTRMGQPHVYVPLYAISYPGWWPPGSVVEGDSDTHQWQLLVPEIKSSCHVFPNAGWYGDVASDGAYVWALWRPYTCCQREGMWLIFH